MFNLYINQNKCSVQYHNFFINSIITKYKITKQNGQKQVMKTYTLSFCKFEMKKKHMFIKFDINCCHLEIQFTYCQKIKVIFFQKRVHNLKITRWLILATKNVVYVLYKAIFNESKIKTTKKKTKKKKKKKNNLKKWKRQKKQVNYKNIFHNF